MKPAYLISLSAAEKRLIAEVAAAQSQIEWLMRLAVQHLLEVPPKLAQTIMGSTSIRANSAIWIETIREKCTDDNLKAWAEFAFEQIPEISGHRNNLVHTLFGLTNDEDDASHGPIGFLYAHRTNSSYLGEPRHGVRVKDSGTVKLDNIVGQRNALFRLSVIFAHIESSLSPHLVGPSPWLRRLGAKHPPQSSKLSSRSARRRSRRTQA